MEWRISQSSRRWFSPAWSAVADRPGPKGVRELKDTVRSVSHASKIRSDNKVSRWNKGIQPLVSLGRIAISTFEKPRQDCPSKTTAQLDQGRKTTKWNNSWRRTHGKARWLTSIFVGFVVKVCLFPFFSSFYHVLVIIFRWSEVTAQFIEMVTYLAR